ncbi:MAG: hypothetical protein A2X64_02035 [Ignavibacteria bacterium GWF2_33_9]|nr:MAG: hypothetical protein A2X64_02035 [Ignavibacteria bacterium GWF2_33_9]
MFPLFETILLQNSKLHNPEFHLERISSSRKKLWNKKDTADIQKIFSEFDPKLVENYQSEKKYKFKLSYDEKNAEYSVQLYKTRKINRLIALNADEIEYSLKYTNRLFFENLLFNNDISINTELIIIQKGFATDATYANLVFELDGEFFTPTNYILPGTKRAKYLKEKVITEREIRAGEINNFEKIHLINAMLNLGEITINSPFNIPK